MINNYVLSESDSENVFGVISAENKAVLIELTALAIKEEFTYKTVSFRSDSYSERSGTVFMSFNCVSEDDEDSEDIREVELNLTAVYNFDDIKMDNEDLIKRRIKYGNEMALYSLMGLFMLFGFIYVTDWINHKAFLVIVSIQILTTGFFYFQTLFKIKKVKQNGTT